MRKFGFLAFIVILALSLPEVQAQKEPVWSWSSPSAVTNVAISSDSNNISATYAQSVSLWKNISSSPYDTETLSEGIGFMEMSSDGKYVLTGEETNKLTLWKEGTKVWDKGGFLAGLYGIDISSDGFNITAVDRRNVYFFSKESNVEVWNANFPAQEMSVVSISPDGKYIAAGTYGGNVYVFLTSNEEDVWFHSEALDGKITDIDFSGDSSHLIIGTSSGRVHVYSSEGGDPTTMPQQEEVSCVSAGANSKHYLYGTNNGKLTLFDGINAVNVWEKDIGGDVTDCAFNGRGTYVAAGSDNKKIILANVTTGDEVWRVNAVSSVNSISLSYKGENIVVGTDLGLSIYYEKSLDNQAPTANIDLINPVIALPGELITFTGSGSDIDGFISKYLWSSSIDGNLSSSDNFTLSNLTTGLHTISLTVQDNEGRWSIPVTLEIGVGDFPEVSILSVLPCPEILNCTVSFNEKISIIASANSTTSEDITIEVFEWSSSIDGVISNSLNLITSELSLGSHKLTLRVKNSVGLWSANVSVNILINSVPVITLDSINPNPIIAGNEAQITVAGFDSDEEGSLSYFWSTDTITLFNENEKALFSSDISDKGNHIVSVYALDSKGAKSNVLNITISIISQPSVELVCDSEIEINEEAFFTATASKPQGSIVKYEWDFDSPSRVVPDSLDSVGFNFATHSYNSTPDDEDGYIVVIKVTDNDGLTATDFCQIPVVQGSIGKSDSAVPNGDGFVSQLTTSGGLIGISLLLVGIGGLVYFFSRDNFGSYSNVPVSESYEPPSKVSSPLSKADDEEVTKPTKRKVIRKRVVNKAIPEMMTVECPRCSSQIDIPKISGAQALKCPDCGLEGEIDI